MAYCVLSNLGEVHQWGILNLLQSTTTELPKCTCATVAKKSKPATVCGKNAKYRNQTSSPEPSSYFCETHAKKQTTWIIPKREHGSIFLKKQKVDTVRLIYVSLKLGDADIRKQDMVDAIVAYYSAKSLQNVDVSKGPSAKEVDLVSVGRSIKLAVSQLRELDKITHIVIENQISTIATRMKTIQGMLAQTFIMLLGDSVHIEFVSSMNKLKGLSTSVNTINTGSPEMSKYKVNKTDGVRFCRRFLDENPETLGKWREVFDASPKKDDLADSFLQGIWYLKMHKLINYAENLKINSLSLS